MNIRLSCDFNFREFKSLFPEIQLFDSRSKEDIDLLIFPGGEDVTLEMYLDPDEAENFTQLCNCNPERDKFESEILNKAFSGRIRVNKILGVCRGAQFLNVLFGGLLYPDLSSYGYEHELVHNLRHITKSRLSFFEAVNSFHHQGIRKVGNYYAPTGERLRINTIAYDEKEIVHEIVTWNNNILGIQFHPEYYSNDNTDKIQFIEFLTAWVTNKVEIY